LGLSLDHLCVPRPEYTLGRPLIVGKPPLLL
jgi:hypothetical protein